jgi:hypothetical protein
VKVLPVKRSAVFAPDGVDTKRLVVLENIGVETIVTTEPTNTDKIVAATIIAQFLRKICQ